MFTVSLERLQYRLDALSHLTDPDLPYTRRAFTGRFLEGRKWLEQEFEQAGLEIHTDAGGNLVGRLEGEHSRALVLGSHTDTVSGGGRFDGILGVLAALEVAQTLHENGVKLRHSLEVLDFLSEEPSEYGGLSCVGSRAWAGTLTEEMLAFENADGERLEQAMVRVGADLERVRQGPLRHPDELAAYLELHIEQGPALEGAGLPIGVVTGIAGIERWRLAVIGEADHAGTTPMHLRFDALVGASSVVLELNARAKVTPGLVATVGTLTVRPNAANIVPEAVELVTDTRSIDPDALERFNAAFVEDMRTLLSAQGLTLVAEKISRSRATPCDPRIQSALRHAAQARRHAFLELPSGAGHDGVQIAALCPIGMLFVPSVDGHSHTRAEFTYPHDILAGTETLLEAVLELDRTLE